MPLTEVPAEEIKAVRASSLLPIFSPSDPSLDRLCERDGNAPRLSCCSDRHARSEHSLEALPDGGSRIFWNGPATFSLLFSPHTLRLLPSTSPMASPRPVFLSSSAPLLTSSSLRARTTSLSTPSSLVLSSFVPSSPSSRTDHLQAWFSPISSSILHPLILLARLLFVPSTSSANALPPLPNGSFLGCAEPAALESSDHSSPNHSAHVPSGSSSTSPRPASSIASSQRPSARTASSTRRTSTIPPTSALPSSNSRTRA